MLRILIGDDHAVFRRGPKMSCKSTFAPLEVHEAKSGWEMVTLASQGKWDAFIMDVTMPEEIRDRSVGAHPQLASLDACSCVIACILKKVMPCG